jgi:hypothetical protein
MPPPRNAYRRNAAKDDARAVYEPIAQRVAPLQM